jgi:patatin-related protein
MKELRIGLVLYGGVSLAVYMNGIVTELWQALRASRAHHGGGEGGAGTGTAAVYAELLERLERSPGAEALRIVVDAVAGTSAGGVNGAALAKAVVEGADAGVLNTVWIEKADIAALRAEPPFRAPWWLRSLLWLATRFSRLGALQRRVDGLPGLSWVWLRDTVYALLSAADGRTTPLDGRYFSRMIATTFGGMSASGDGRRLLPERGTFDLFLTATDLHGWPRHLPLSRGLHPSDLFERTHAHVMAFATRPTGVSFADDFDLAFAARATAGFPVAFAPLAYGDVAADFAVARPGERLPTLAEFARRRLREHVLAGLAGGRAWMIDGGVLDNKPFADLARAIEDKPAEHEVRRIVMYIEPDPESAIGAPPADAPLPYAVLKGLYALFRHEPIYDDLRRLDQRNAKVERLRDIRQANFANAERAARDAGAAAGLAWPPQTADLERWRKLTNAEAARFPLSGYSGYVALKARRAAGVVAEVICRALEYPDDARHGYFVRALVREWLRREGALEPPAYADEEGHRLAAAQRALLDAFDVPFRIRRVRALVGAVNQCYVGPEMPAAVAERRQARAALDGCKAVLAEIAFAFETALRDVADVGAAISGALGDIGTDEIDRFIVDLRFSADATIGRYAAQLRAVYADLSARFAAAGDEQNRRITAAIDALPAWARAKVAAMLAAFPFLDLALFPLMDAAGVTDLIVIETMRVSPHDAVFLSRDPARLKGRNLGAFAAFLERGAREHDLMWGRLDGAERLIELIAAAAVPDEAQRQSLRREFTRRAMLAILDDEAARPGSGIGDTARELSARLAAMA